jgi:hypothetical protein
MILPPSSHNLRKHGDSQQVVQEAFLLLAVLFFVAAKLKDGPVMPEAIYGEWVVSIDAEAWAVSIMLASVVYLVGIIINGNWRWSPAFRLIGATWHVFTLGAFTVGSGAALYGDSFALGCFVFALVHLRFAYWNMCDLWRAIKAGGEFWTRKH